MENEKLGKAIAYLRKKAGYTQQQLAGLLDISDKAISKWERGLSCPDISLLAKLSVLLDTDIESLLEGNVSYYKHMWKGVLFLENNINDSSICTQIYDKPMVYYLLSYFLLVGIREILIICSLKEKVKTEQVIGDGKQFGVRIFYCANDQNSDVNRWLINEKAFLANYNVMLVYGKRLLYGLDLTKYFQRAMARQHGITILATQNKYGKEIKDIAIDDSDSKMELRKAYCSMPILFLGMDILDKIFNETGISISIWDFISKDEEVYVEMIGRGMIELNLTDEEDIADASMLVRAVQGQQREYIACLEEIAWRRGLISKKELSCLAEKKKGTMYGKYIQKLCEENKENERI